MSSTYTDHNDIVSDSETDTPNESDSREKARQAIDFSNLQVTEEPFIDDSETYVPEIDAPPGTKVMHVRFVWERLNKGKDYDAFKRSQIPRKDPSAPAPEPVVRKDGTVVRPKEDITYKQHPSYTVADHVFKAERACYDAKHAKYSAAFPAELARLNAEKAAVKADKGRRAEGRKRKALAQGERGGKKYNGNPKLIIDIHAAKDEMSAAIAPIWNKLLSQISSEYFQ